MLAEGLMSSEPDLLTGPCEIVSSIAVKETRASVGYEQRLGRMADQPIAFGKIANQVRDDARVERQ
ncbi:hypothetical protein D9M71_803880 [compost metagenome]